MGNVIVVGSSNTDMVVTTFKMPLPGETVMGNDFEIIAGGKGANQAVAAARAGSTVTFVTKTGGDDFGKQAIEGYRKDKINTDKIFTDPDKPSGIAVIIVDELSGQNSIVVAPGSNNSLSIQEIDSLAADIQKADVLLVQLEIPLETVQRSLQIASDSGIQTILNPAPAQPLHDDILGLVDIITPNESETFILTGIYPDSPSAIINAAEQLLKKVRKAVIITLGSSGAYYISKNGHEAFIPTHKVEAVDTTAAGDVFNGYFAHALANGQSLTDCIHLANTAASISVKRKGAQTSIPYLKEIPSKS